MKNILIATLCFVNAMAFAQQGNPPSSALPKFPGQLPNALMPKKPQSPAANTGTGSKTEPQGFTSKKTGKTLSSAHIEDITNENFPDMIESFDYPNAEIGDVIKAISELTGKNFIIDPNVHGKISIIAPSRITVAEAYKAFLAALAINGMAIVPGDGFLKIKPARAAQRDNIDTFSGAYYPTSDQMITRIIKLKYISAEQVDKSVRLLQSKDGEMVSYPPTNSIIISDYGGNIDRVVKILEQLDVQGFEEQLEVIRIHHTRAKDMSELVDQIINKGEGGNNKFGGGVPRFRPAGVPATPSGSGADVYSLVVPDERTNSIIVVGNKTGIEKIRKLIARLDYPMRPDEQGGFFVYALRHAEAEPIANVLNGIASESKKAQDQANAPGARPNIGGMPGAAPQIGPAATAIFGGEVKITAEKNTNSLIIVANKQDYETIKSLLAKIDIARDQVFIKTVIMEMNSNVANSWGVDVYKFAGGTNGAGRIGFRGSDDISSITDPSKDKGAILGFGSGEMVDVTIAGTKIQVPNLAALIRLLKTNAKGNILSTPQIMALNNEESMIEVGAKVPVSKNDNVGANGVANSNIQRENVTTKLVITPYISPDTDTVKMKIDQSVADLSSQSLPAAASELAKNSIITTTRNIKTQIVVNSGDTAVLGGLMKDDERESVTKVPVLGDIPIIGWLFKSQGTSRDKTNLVVFITPKIVRNEEDSASILDDKINERIDFIQKSMNGRDPHGKYIDALPRRVKAKAKLNAKPEEPAVESF